MSKAIMEFDLADPASKEQHEHAADGHRYFRILEDLAERFDTKQQDLLRYLGRKHGVPRVAALRGSREAVRA